jgi:hypothetical protein
LWIFSTLVFILIIYFISIATSVQWFIIEASLLSNLLIILFFTSHSFSNLVFFDFLGAFVIRWSEGTGTLINTLAAAVSIYCLFKNMKAALTRGETFNLLHCVSWDCNSISVWMNIQARQFQCNQKKCATFLL